MVRNCRNTVRTGALTALLLLAVLPGAAGAATPSGLVGQTLAQVDATVQQTSTTVSHVTAQVDGAVARTVEGAKQAVGPVADPVRSTPTPEVGQRVSAEVVQPAAKTVAAATPGQVSEAAPGAAQPAAPQAAQVHRHDARPAAGRQRQPAPAAASAAALRDSVAAASDRAAAQSASTPVAGELPASDRSSGSRPDGPSFGAFGGTGPASAAFSAGAFAILLSALFLAASALRTRLPRFDEVGRPLPLVFALERPG